MAARRAHVRRGGLSNLREAEDSTLTWTVSEQHVPADGVLYRVADALLQARVDPATQQLSLTNPDPIPNTLVTPVLVQAWDHGAGAHLTAQRDLAFEGQTLRESEALQKLRHWCWLKNHPQEIELEPRIWQLRTAWAELERIAPEVAHRARPLMEAEEAAWRAVLIEQVRG